MENCHCLYTALAYFIYLFKFLSFLQQQKVLFVEAFPDLFVKEQLLTFLVLLLSEEDENSRPLSTDCWIKTTFWKCCWLYYSLLKISPIWRSAGECWCICLYPWAISTFAFNRLPFQPSTSSYRLPERFGRKSVSLWEMPALLEYGFLKSVTKCSLISLTAGSVPEVILTDLRTSSI